MVLVFFHRYQSLFGILFQYDRQTESLLKASFSFSFNDIKLTFGGISGELVMS